MASSSLGKLWQVPLLRASVSCKMGVSRFISEERQWETLQSWWAHEALRELLKWRFWLSRSMRGPTFCIFKQHCRDVHASGICLWKGRVYNVWITQPGHGMQKALYQCSSLFVLPLFFPRSCFICFWKLNWREVGVKKRVSWQQIRCVLWEA